MGWRGASWRTPGLDYLTFWNRKDTAHRVGEREATESLVRIRRAAYARVDPCDRAPTRLVMMGHSFGGALIYSALSQLVATSLLDPSSDKLADAIVLFNPAFEAARWKSLITILPSSQKPIPKIAVFTSKSDRATGWAFPTGRSLNTLLETSRTIESPVRGDRYRERTSNNRAVGHFAPFLTHDLRSACADAPASDEERRRRLHVNVLIARPTARAADEMDEMLKRIRAQYDAGQPMDFGTTCLVPREGLLSRQMSAFNVAMDRDVWNGHAFEQTDERRKKVLAFLALFVPFAGAVERPRSCDQELAPQVGEAQPDGQPGVPRSAPGVSREPEYVF